MPEVVVPVARWARWVENFVTRHGGVALDTVDGTLAGRAPDGSTFVARLPFDREYDGGAAVAPFLVAAEPPARWGVLLVRKGGFAVALLRGSQMVEHKVGQRHVQGRTKAGGQSQQRFARRRDNQARQAYEAAADHAARILAGPALPVATGGEHAAVSAVLADRRLAHLEALGRFLDVPDPRRRVLEDAILRAGSLRVSVENAA